MISAQILPGCPARYRLYFAFVKSAELQACAPSPLHEARKLRDLEAYAAHMKTCPACAARAPVPGYEVRTDDVIAADSARVLAEAKA